MTVAASPTRQLFLMPDVGEGLVEAEIIDWRVQVGETVTDGQPVCEVETAKAAVELPIPYDGVVAEIFAAPGETVQVGSPIIAVTTAPAERQEVLVGYGPREATTVRRRPRKPAGGLSSAGPGPAEPSPGTPRAKPPVRKLAKDHGVELADVRPSGPHGVITRKDVLDAARRGDDPTAVAGPADAGSAAEDSEVRIPVRGVRRATARAMVASAFTAPHATEFIDVDMTRSMKLVRRLKASRELGDVPVGPLLLVATAYLTAVRRHPGINAVWDEPNQEIVLRRRIDLGIAAATPRGLIVPHIKDAGRLSMDRLASSLATLTAQARSGRTPPGDLRGGTTTITNIGALGVDGGAPILNPGEASILAFGAVRRKPWVHKGKPAVRDVATLSLTFDHRLVDGELGARVLSDTAAVLENPRLLMVWR
ncbi:dihydrolipoamide acetyltransferase family protein [Streptomyces sp. NPDC047917]|uniref:dihydrolipoamide acetyltransferase family protein n=1 Tax=Streptomyces sp. NPDC047917 TaxID=3365491 RepID=UPI00371CC50A